VRIKKEGEKKGVAPKIRTEHQTKVAKLLLFDKEAR